MEVNSGVNDDAETSAFNVNIRLFMFQIIIIIINYM